MSNGDQEASSTTTSNSFSVPIITQLVQTPQRNIILLFVPPSAAGADSAVVPRPTPTLEEAQSNSQPTLVENATSEVPSHPTEQPVQNSEAVSESSSTELVPHNHDHSAAPRPPILQIDLPHVLPNRVSRLLIPLPHIMNSVQVTQQPSEQTPEASGQMEVAQPPMVFVIVGSPTMTPNLSEEAFESLLNQLMQAHQPRTNPASEKVVEKLPNTTIDVTKQQDAVRCPICMDDFEVGKEVVEMPCHHLFDRDCLKTWLKQANTCPVCRAALPSEEEFNNQPLPSQQEPMMTESPTQVESPVEVPTTVPEPTPIPTSQQDITPAPMEIVNESVNTPSTESETG